MGNETPRDPRKRPRPENVRMIRRPVKLHLTRRSDDVAPSEPLKAAVMAALMLGQSAEQVAIRFGLPVTDVRRWEAAYDISNPLKRRDSLSEMLLVFVEQELASLMAISIATSDEDWIKDQNAADIAILHGAKQDRLMKILEAYSRAQTSRQQIQGEVVEDD
jgi:hypothetical protein